MKRDDIKESALIELDDLEAKIKLLKSRLKHTEISTKSISLETGRLNRLLGQLEATLPERES